jgi:hypothetical protein
VPFITLVGLDEKERLQIFNMNFDAFTADQLQMKAALVREKIVGFSLEDRLVLEFDHHLVRDHFDVSREAVGVWLTSFILTSFGEPGYRKDGAI